MQAKRINNYRTDVDLNRYNWIVGGELIDGDLREGELLLTRLIEQCQSFPDPKPSVACSSYLGLDLYNRCTLSGQRYSIPEELLYESLFREGDLPNKARSILNLLNDPEHTKRVLTALDVYSKDWKKTAENDLQLFAYLM